MNGEKKVKGDENRNPIHLLHFRHSFTSAWTKKISISEEFEQITPFLEMNTLHVIGIF